MKREIAAPANPLLGMIASSTASDPADFIPPAPDKTRLPTEINGRFVLVDLHEVTAINSGGIAMFMEAMHRVAARGGELVLFGLREDVHRVFATAKLDQVFHICSTREEALHHRSGASCRAQHILN